MSRILVSCLLFLAPVDVAAQVDVAVVKNTYQDETSAPRHNKNPDYIQAAGLERLLSKWGARLARPVAEVRLTPEEERQYGEWHRVGLANGRLADLVAELAKQEVVVLGLEADCNSVLGVLGGLQRSASGTPRKVGLVYFDAHGDFNTPETTLSGMLGGMPVAVAAGHALERLRLKSGLAQPLPLENILWGGVRDLDPLERERFETHRVRQISVADIRTLSVDFKRQMKALAERSDVIYVHVDMDVLDPREVPGHPLTVPDGPTSEELARAVTEMLRHPKVVAFAVASTPAGRKDPTGVSRRAALRLLRAAVEGLRQRPTGR